MKERVSDTTQSLIDAFNKFKRLHRKKPTVEGVRHSEIGLLFCIRENAKDPLRGIKVSDIGSLLKVSAPSVTQSINGLEDKGYLERNMDSEDRRAVRVKLTETGEKLLETLQQGFLSTFSGLVEYLGEEDSLKLAELLSKSFEYFEESSEKHNCK